MATSKRRAKPDPTWPPQVRDLWDRITNEFQVLGDAYAELLLTTACGAFGDMVAAQAVLDRDGRFITDRFGVPRAHPATREHRLARAAMLQALAQLNLDLESPPTTRGR